MQTHLGVICKGDFALIKIPSTCDAHETCCVGRLCGFFANKNEFHANVELYTHVDELGYDWDTSSPSSEIVDVAMIQRPCFT